MKSTYSYSTNEENYHGEFASHEEAFEEAKERGPFFVTRNTVWTGKNTPVM